jgi:hypothetical protein
MPTLMQAIIELQSVLTYDEKILRILNLRITTITSSHFTE